MPPRHNNKKRKAQTLPTSDHESENSQPHSPARARVAAPAHLPEQPAATPPAPRGNACRNWVFTINNPTEELNFADWTNPPEYAVWQLERGEQGTLHFQGYVRLKKPLRRHQLSELIPHAFLEIARGTAAQCRAYCTKEEGQENGPWEFGVFPELEQGKRSDWEAIRDMVKSGEPEQVVAERYPGHYVRNASGIARLKSIFSPKRIVMPVLHVIIGPSRAGKSHYARERLPNAYWKSPNNKWWDMYDGQKEIVIDEYKGWLPITDLNRLCDKYDYLIEIKGGSVRCLAEHVIITSNYFPEEWYDQTRYKAAYDAFCQRVTLWSIYFSREDHRDYEDYGAFRTAWLEAEYTITPNSVSHRNFNTHSST